MNKPRVSDEELGKVAFQAHGIDEAVARDLQDARRELKQAWEAMTGRYVASPDAKIAFLQRLEKKYGWDR